MLTSKFYKDLVSKKCLEMVLVRRYSRSAASKTVTSKFASEVGGTLSQQGPVVGAFASCHHSFTQEATNDFAALCGDNNPLHTNPEFAGTTMFGGPIVHGILVSSVFSTLFGRSLHGSIYVSQTFSFKRPVYVGSSIRAQIEILTIEKKRKGHLITCSTNAFTENRNGDGKEEALAISGEAKCLLPFEAYPDVQASV